MEMCRLSAYFLGVLGAKIGQKRWDKMAQTHKKNQKLEKRTRDNMYAIQ